MNVFGIFNFLYYVFKKLWVYKILTFQIFIAFKFATLFVNLLVEIAPGNATLAKFVSSDGINTSISHLYCSRGIIIDIVYLTRASCYSKVPLGGERNRLIKFYRQSVKWGLHYRREALKFAQSCFLGRNWVYI